MISSAHTLKSFCCGLNCLSLFKMPEDIARMFLFEDRRCKLVFDVDIHYPVEGNIREHVIL